MTDYQVVVPSYRRAQRLAENTLTTLLNGNIPPELITIYTHDNDPQHAAYQDVATALGTNHIATPARGIIQQRRWISDNTPTGTHIVTLDDDVKSLKTLGRGGKLHPVTDLDKYFRDMFQETRNTGLKTWGLAPVGNPYFMREGTTDNLKFLIYTCIGYINEPDNPAQHNTVTTKDDYEHSIRRWWWDGGVLRDNGTWAEADVYKAAGGLMGTGQRTPQKAEDAIRELERQWPGIIRRNTRRKSDYPEITLNPKPRHNGNPHTTPPPGEHTNQ